MAEYNSSLPIRSETDPDELVRGRIVDGVDPSKLAEVDADKNLHIEMHGNDEGGVDRVQKLSQAGHSQLDGIYTATNPDPSQVGLVGHTRAASPADSDQIKKLTAISNGSVHSLDISLHDEDGAAYSESNPLYVQSGSEGTEVFDYNEASAIAPNISANHDYTVGGGLTGKLKKVLCSASGKAKFELQLATDGATFVTKAVGFNSTANPNCEFDFSGVGMESPAAGKYRIIKKNLDKEDQNMYSTFIGYTI